MMLTSRCLPHGIGNAKSVEIASVKGSSHSLEARECLPQRHHLPRSRVEPPAARERGRRAAPPRRMALPRTRLAVDTPAPAAPVSPAQPQRMPWEAQLEVAADEVHGRVVGAGAEQQLAWPQAPGLQAAQRAREVRENCSAGPAACSAE